MLRNKLPRMYELLDDQIASDVRTTFFRDFELSFASTPLKWKQIAHMEAELAGLDIAAWDHLKEKAGPLFAKHHARRGWESALNELNEARAYNYLVSRGCTNVAFIPRLETKTPDLRARLGEADVLCEAKTINKSEIAVNARIQQAVRSIATRLPDEFFRKIAAATRSAAKQMADYCKATKTKRFVFFVINFDDELHEYVDDYLVQIEERRDEFLLPHLEIAIQVKPKYYVASADPQDWQTITFLGQK
jgi:hypothetical protein